MDHSKTIPRRKLSLTDSLINGLIGGILAGLGMLVWLLAAGLLGGDSPQQILERFLVPGQPPNMFSGVFIHLGVSAVYGAIFGLLLRVLPAAWQMSAGKLAAGLVYGMLLYLLAKGIILPGTGSPMVEFSSLALASAHLMYGALLGAITHA